MIRWKKVEKRLPDTDRQVFALAGSCAYLAYYREGEWWMTYTIKLGDVTRWMEVPGEPKDLEYWVKRLREWWERRKVNAQQASDLLTGWTSRNAQLGKKVVYYRDRSGKVVLGLPEDRPAPKGHQKIICNNVFEAERYSELQRRQERVEHGRTMEQREQVEGSAQKEWRRNAHNLMANARNQVNRDFMEAALKRNAEHRPWEYERTSYLHQVGHEEGH